MRATHCYLTVLASVVMALAGQPARSASLDELAIMGQEAMSRGDYAEAIKHYEVIVETGQTFVSLMAVKFDLGWCYYLTGQPDKAIPLFESLSGKRSPSEAVKQQSMFLLAECYARMAATMPAGSSERKKALDESVKLHTKFQKEYPQNPNIVQSLYGRAYAYYLDNNMEKAEADLKEAINRQPGSQTARDASFLLASVYSAQGLEKLKAGEKETAKAYTEKARELFADLARGEGANLALANDSVFSLAETWFAGGEYLQAIRYYQQLRSKMEVAQNIQKLQEQLQQQLAEDLSKEKDTTMVKAAIDKIRAQVRDVMRAPDMMISGYFRMAEAFYRLQRYEEMRTICRHIFDFADDEGKKQALYMIINSYLQENDPDSAAVEFKDFQDMFGVDVEMVDTVALSIGQLYLAQGQLEKSKEFLYKSAEDNPEGRRVQEAMYLAFAAEYMDKQHEKAIKSIEAYMEKFPKGKYVANAMYYKAVCLAALQQWDAALAAINAVIERFPKGTEDFTAIDEAFYQKGWILNESKKHAEAVKHLNEFLEKFKDSSLRPEAMYQLGVALHGEQQDEMSRSVLRSIADEYPDHAIAPLALYQVAVQCFDKKDYPGMEEAIRFLLERYPENPTVVECYFWLGWIARQDGRYDEALEHLEKSIELNPSHELAPESMLTIAQIYKTKADKMGSPIVLTEEQRAVYKETVLRSVSEFEKLMVRYPASTQMLNSVPSIANGIYDLVRYRQFSQAEALDYFKSAIQKHSADPRMSALLSFSMGSFLMKTREKEQALGAFKKALSLDPEIRLSPVMLTEYADALKESNALEDAEKICMKIIEDYPDDPLVLAPAWYGIADIKYREEDYEKAEELFRKVLSEFEWFEEGKQGRVMLAKILEQKGQYAEAEKMFEEVWKQEKGVTRLGAMLGVARCQLAQAEQAKKEGKTSAWQENIRVADENLTKIIVMFEAYPDCVAEALWLKGKAYELVGNNEEARKTYSRLVLEDEYKNIAPWSGMARERLKKIGGVLAPSSPAVP